MQQDVLAIRSCAIIDPKCSLTFRIIFQLLIDKSKKKALIITRDSEQVIEANDMQTEVTPIWKWLLKD